MQDAEVGDLLQGEIVAGQVQPRIKKHGTVTGGQDEAVAVEPLRLGGVIPKKVAEERRSDFRAPEGKPKMARRTFVDCVHGETARFVGSAPENLELRIHNGVDRFQRAPE